MITRLLSLRSAGTFAMVLAIALSAAPAPAADAAQARLVHCGKDTCLLLFGHRPRTDITARIGMHDLAIEGGRVWHLAIPLDTVRDWAVTSGYSLTLSLIDAQVGTETRHEVILPPGALGRRVELASLVIRGH